MSEPIKRFVDYDRDYDKDVEYMDTRVVAMLNDLAELYERLEHRLESHTHDLNGDVMPDTKLTGDATPPEQV